MFKVIVLVDCDECGNSFDSANVSSLAELVCEEQVRILPELEMQNLARSSELHGWRFMPSYCICPQCIREEEKMADWLQEPEEHPH
jgi:hypothetical protein